ncbi:MAG: Asp-tRNA(Asn)/Glu-tRNA(Gln) amidotransferase subunit GatA [Candidatus Pacebacteria bacterium]|nr:Asp-tRNA(Asn)/Glu-tRNA(Gln) amidotransferase subunit GatA [Candidatus Paceibacterota bacterium]
MSKKLNELSIEEAARALRARECSVHDLFEACTHAAKEKNVELNAYLELFDADEMAIAAAQARIEKEGEAAPMLCGIPLAMKDNILIEGKVASAASKILSTHTATYDATITKRLKEAGALFVGRTNMDEFALGGSTENSAFGPTRNPFDVTRVAGGTSGGSAAAVASHMAIGGLGTDTGGSLRNPASYCGLVGMKSTYGGVPRTGLIAAASSFDQAGPLTHTVRDARILLQTIRGKDALDSTSIDLPATTKPLKKKIGVLRSLMEGGMEADMTARFEETLAGLTDYEIVPIEIPSIKPALAAYYIINFAEVSTNLARFDGVRYGVHVEGNDLLEDYVRSRTEGFGPETKRRILLGTFVLSSGYIDAYYRKADKARKLLRQEFDHAFESVDFIATPTMPSPAFVIGEHADPLSLYLEDVFTVTANLTGLPAISVPMGTVNRDGKDLPVGIQFMGAYGEDDSLFTAGAMVTKEAL